MVNKDPKRIQGYDTEALGRINKHQFEKFKILFGEKKKILDHFEEKKNPKPKDKSALVEGQRLVQGESLTSPNGRYVAAMQLDGNLVITRIKKSGNIVKWSSDTDIYMKPYAVFQSDGNFVIYDALNIPRWHSKSEGLGPGPRSMALKNDGNLVIFDVYGKPTWYSELV